MPGVYSELDRSLKAIPVSLREQPQALLVITAHWIEDVFAVGAHPQPGMIYDYGGFPAKYYQIRYPAPGSPALAHKIHMMLNNGNLPTRLDAIRGFDHGTYTVTYPMYPRAEIPVIQLSIHRSFDPGLHIELGRLLRPLRSEGVLIIGSGLSFHNLRKFGSAGQLDSRQFDQWLHHAMSLPGQERSAALCAWSSAPSARAAHPVEDHLLPLMAVVGAAETEPATTIYHEDGFFGGLTVSGFRFGAL